MRFFALCLRQCFCRHDFIREYVDAEEKTSEWHTAGVKVSLLCKKCGYHRSFWLV